MAAGPCDAFNAEQERISQHFDYQRWTIYCRMMLLRIARGEFEGAHAALRDFCRGPWKRIARVDSHIAAVLPVRIANALEDGGYDTIDSVRLEDDETLLELPNMGERTVREIRERIEQVLTGNLLENYFDDELQVDWDLCLRVGPGGSAGVLDCTCHIEKAKPMSVLEKIAALSDPKLVAEIDSEIAEHESAITKLRTARKMVCGSASRRATKPLDAEKLALADKMVGVLQKAKQGLTPSELAKRAGTNHFLVGKIAKADTRFTRTGKEVALA
jgi:hypothetical protein